MELYQRPRYENLSDEILTLKLMSTMERVAYFIVNLFSESLGNIKKYKRTHG